MQINVVNKENKKVGAMELPDGVFAVKWNPDLVHQVTTSMRANRRAPLAHAKGKGEVSGGRDRAGRPGCAGAGPAGGGGRSRDDFSIGLGARLWTR